MVQWLGFHAFTSEGLGSIPGWRTKIPISCTAWPKRGKKARKYKVEIQGNLVFLLTAFLWGSHSHTHSDEGSQEKCVCFVTTQLSPCIAYFSCGHIGFRSKAQIAEIIRSFKGHVRKLLRHAEASAIVEYAYNDKAILEQRNMLTEELYGNTFQLYKVMLQDSFFLEIYFSFVLFLTSSALYSECIFPLVVLWRDCLLAFILLDYFVSGVLSKGSYLNFSFPEHYL